MPCPVCQKPIGQDHRHCVFQLLSQGKIQTIDEWEALSTPKTIRKGRVRAVLPKE